MANGCVIVEIAARDGASINAGRNNGGRGGEEGKGRGRERKTRLVMMDEKGRAKVGDEMEGRRGGEDKRVSPADRLDPGSGPDRKCASARRR
jgi:hypothetical protein